MQVGPGRVTQPRTHPNPGYRRFATDILRMLRSGLDAMRAKPNATGQRRRDSGAPADGLSHASIWQFCLPTIPDRIILPFDC